MAKQASLFLPVGTNTFSVIILPGTTTVSQLAFTANVTNGSDVKAILVTSTDTSARDLQLFITRSSVDYSIGTVTIPITAGTVGTTPAIDLLNSTGMAGLPLDSVGKRYIPMAAGDTLRVAPTTTITTAKQIVVSVLGQDY